MWKTETRLGIFTVTNINLKQRSCKYKSWRYETNRKEHRENIQNIEIVKKFLEGTQKNAHGKKSHSEQTGPMKLKAASSKQNTWKEEA